MALGMGAMNRRNIILWAAVSPGLLLGGSVALWLLGEVLWLVSFASPAEVADYHFGSEAMMAHGGWPYTSVWAYAASGVGKSCLFLVAAGGLVYGA